MALKLFAGSANPGLADVIARGLGTPLGACAKERLPDGELHLELKESVRRICRADGLDLRQPPEFRHGDHQA